MSCRTSTSHTSRAASAASSPLVGRPDRREVRAITAIDRTGLLYDVKLTRDTSALRKDVFPPDPVNGHVGTIVNALDLLITALLGVSMTERRHLPLD
jgi:hypothetical protein